MSRLLLPGLRSRFRRRPSEPAWALACAERRTRLLARDLREARAIAERLRQDLAEVEAERDQLARELLRSGRRLPVIDVGPVPAGPGVRNGRMDGSLPPEGPGREQATERRVGRG